MLRGKKAADSDPEARGRYWVGMVLLTILMGAFTGYNLNVVTSYEPQHSHFWKRLIQPIGVTYVGVLATAFVARASQRFLRIVSCGCLALSVALVAAVGYRQVLVALRTSDSYSTTSSRQRVMAWLRMNVSPDEVVGTTDRVLIDLIPGVTGNWVFVANGDLTTVSDEEVMTRYILASRLEGADAEEVRNRLKPFDASGPAKMTISTTLLVARGAYTPERDALVTRLCDVPLDVDAFGGRRLDYYILRASASPTTLLEVYPRAKTSYQVEEWVVYQSNAYIVDDSRTPSGTSPAPATRRHAVKGRSEPKAAKVGESSR